MEVTALREKITTLLAEAAAFELQTVALETEVRCRWRWRRWCASRPRWEQCWERLLRPRHYAVIVAALRADVSATPALTVSVTAIGEAPTTCLK